MTNVVVRVVLPTRFVPPGSEPIPAGDLVLLTLFRNLQGGTPEQVAQIDVSAEAPATIVTVTDTNVPPGLYIYSGTLTDAEGQVSDLSDGVAINVPAPHGAPLPPQMLSATTV